MRYPLIFVAGLAMAAGCQDSENTLLDKATNSPPVANAGDNIVQDADIPVQLNGAGSYDPDGDAILFHWGFDTAPAGSVFGGDSWTMVNNNTVEPTTSFMPGGFSTSNPGTPVVSSLASESVSCGKPRFVAP